MATMIRMMLGRELLRQPFFLSAAASSSHRCLTGLADFFEEGRDPKGDQNVTYGRSWKASELRNKSWEDLHQLWYVMLKEKNLLLSQRQMLLSQNYRMPNPERVPKVRKTMCRIKQVLTERALAEEDASKRKRLREIINAM
ncbi:hypothetical protein BDL97_04G031500 [Sphagnum fallax]|jgi:large subunit ribosomal protein L47|nr:hypothetical protein BDL97_04G031500 [Sphagnum fallax]